MNFEVLTLFPAMLEGFFSESILGRAQESGAIRVRCTDIRDYTRNKHRRVDDTPYGGGYGIVLACQPVVDCLCAVKSRLTGSVHTVYLSPQGGLFNHKKARELAGYDNLILLCGHYEGVDQRAIDAVVDEELSLGDFVLTGGELAAMAVCDAVVRYVPGVLGSSDSTEEESFTGGLLEYPQYTRPRVFEGAETPEVLLNGDHAKIRAWRRQQSLLITAKVRPDLFETAPMSEKERQETLLLLQKLQKEGESHAAP